MAKLQEIWLPATKIPGYEISSLGRIKFTKTNRILKTYNAWKTSSGRLIKKAVFICIKKYGTFTIHRLVMLTFKPTERKDVTIDHIDRNPFNNNLNNLRWATNKEQRRNRGRGTKRKQRNKINIDQLNDIYALSKRHTLLEISAMKNISKIAIWYLLVYMHPDY